MLGVIIALTASLAWAGSSIFIKYLSTRMDSLSMNTMRLWVGAVALITIVFLTGRGTDILHTPVLSIFFVILSGLLSNTAGDTIYIQSLRYLDVSVAYPISQSAFPVFTLLTAIFFLSETFTWFNILGAVCVIAGILMIVRNNKTKVTKKTTTKGVVLSLVAAVLWTAGSVTLKIGLNHVDTILAAATRVTASALVLTGVTLVSNTPNKFQFKTYGTRNLLFVACAGILTYTIGALGYVTAIHLIGAGKTVLLSASAPVFVLPMSVFFLKERLSPLALAGVFIAVAGICLVAL